MKLLLVENYRPLTRALRTALEEEGHHVEVTGDVQLAETRAWTGEHDVILLDLIRGLPESRSLLERWRQQGLRTPILVLNGPDVRAGQKGTIGLEADACISLPFEFDELLAHLWWVARIRHHGSGDAVAQPHPSALHLHLLAD